jgi:hypothetical protein
MMEENLNAPKLVAYRLPNFPAYLKLIPAPADRSWMDLDTAGWANRCLPLRVANQLGWQILNDVPFEAHWGGRPGLDSVQITFKEKRNKYIQSAFGYGILTWYIPYLFRTSPGYNLVARGPANAPKDGIAPLDGVIETDWAVASFSMNWKFTRPLKIVKFEKDEPICTIIPVRRNEAESFDTEIQNLTGDLLAEYDAWLESRKQLMDKKHVGGAPKGFEAHYVRGETVTGRRFAEHQNKLDLKKFVELDKPLPSNVQYEPASKPRKGLLQKLIGY